jgi:hypothetical protein
MKFFDSNLFIVALITFTLTFVFTHVAYALLGGLL